MFLIDVAPSMGKMRQLKMAGANPGETEVVEMTNLEWSLQFVMLKIQEMARNTMLLHACSPLLTQRVDLSWSKD